MEVIIIVYVLAIRIYSEKNLGSLFLLTYNAKYLQYENDSLRKFT